MKSRVSTANLPEFYKDYVETNPSLVLGLSLLTGSLYLINWVYVKNRELEKLDDYAPDPNRGAILMMVLPFSWFFITFILKSLIFTSGNSLFSTIEVVVYILIYLLNLKYLFDFCISFGKITRTRGFFWFLFFLIGTGGIISTAFSFYYLTPLLLFLILAAPAMQAELNISYHRFNMKKEKTLFYN